MLRCFKKGKVRRHIRENKKTCRQNKNEYPEKNRTLGTAVFSGTAAKNPESLCDAETKSKQIQNKIIFP